MLTCKAYQILSAGPHQLPLDVPTDLPTQDFGSADRVWTNLKTILVLSLYYRLHILTIIIIIMTITIIITIMIIVVIE